MPKLPHGFAGVSELLILSLLVVGLAASTILTQQTQRTSTRAANGELCRANGFNCYPNYYYCQYTYSQFNDCNAGYKCGYNCAVPTSTPRPPTNTPLPPTNTPRPPTATPTPACSGLCIPNGETCYQYGNGYCQPYFICCNQVNPPPTPTSTPRPPTNTPLPPTNTPHPPTPTPTPACSGQCIPNGETCYQYGSGYCQQYFICCNIVDPSPTFGPSPTPIRTPTPTTPPQSHCYNYGGFAWCTQTNPAWAYNHFPGGCNDPSKDYWYLRACNQASVSSILCSLAGTQWCDLEYTMSHIPEYAWSTCTGLLFSENLKVFDRFPGSFSYQTINAPYSWDKIDRNLQYGPVVIAGIFNSINHTSLIIGKDPLTGKRIYNDPYFNSENPIRQHRVSSHYLEDYINITIEAAASIRP